MVNFTPKKLSASEADLMEEEYRKIESNPEQLEEVWKQMNSFFAASSVEEDKIYCQDYFRWYTELSWRFLQTRDHDFIVGTAVARQIPMAILLGFDVWKELVWYLFFRAELKLDMESLYGRVREAFMKSEAVIGVWQRTDYKVSDLVNEVQMLDRIGNDSIKEAELRNKLLQIYVPENDLALQKYTAVDADEAVKSLISLVNFFLGTAVENIWYIVDLYTHPDVSILTEEENATTPVTTIPLVATPQPIPSKLEPKIETSKKEEVKPVLPATPAKPIPTQIKFQIESQFKKDAEGNFSDIEGVMASLSELAEKYNDPTIAEMMYYDETENKFKWNI